MENQLITRAALGSTAPLGSLYDARRDCFCTLSIFNKEIPESVLTLIDSHTSDIQLDTSDTMSNKFSKLDVTAELQVSVLAGLFKLSGSGRYLDDKKTYNRSVKNSLIYKVNTKYEQLNIFHEDLKGDFALKAIESGIGTHVVTGISWGANCVLSCTYANRENRDVKKIEGSLTAELNKMSLSISGKASVEFDEEDESTGINFDIRVFGDILPQNEELPTTFEEGLALMKKLPDLVRSCNNGKGKPLTYHLLPLSLLENHIQFSMAADTALQSLEEACLLRVVQLIDQMLKAQLKINEFFQDVTDFQCCIEFNKIKEIGEYKNSLLIEEASVRTKLSKVLTQVRSGKRDVSDLENLIATFYSSDLSPDKVIAALAEWGDLSEKIKLARAVSQGGAQYIGFGASLDAEILQGPPENENFVLFFKKEEVKSNSRTWKGNRQLFFAGLSKTTMSKEKVSCRYFAVDCDIHPDMMPAGISSCIQVIRDGQVLSEDLFHELEKASTIPMAKIREGCSRVPLLYKPGKLTYLNIRCTGNSCNPTEVYEWACIKCKDNLEYGFDDHAYCSCGKARVSDLQFRCTDPKHGVKYDTHAKALLTECITALRPFDEINILILGETGVGKSTWINGFVNFISHSTLEEAEAEPLISLIQTEFTVCNENYETVHVKTGEDTNEHFVAGQSATQVCKVYPFLFGKTRVRLIDTPGIGDTRGINQDKKNFDNILGTLSKHDELHGICILLKPNNARLNLMFRFCIKELLTYLHKDASQNIMFCFTNARGTFYKPGDTMPALKALLKENSVEIPLSRNTIYCYDSESFRFLAAVKNDPPIPFSEDDRLNFAKSWDTSNAEITRMMKYIQSLKPHQIQSTLSLNSARTVILQLARPMADVSLNIQRNKTIMMQEKKAIEEYGDSIEALKSKMYVTRTKLEVRNIPHPKTVCADTACVKTHTMNDVRTSEYVRECHNPCSLNGIPADTLGDSGLLRCWAMNGDHCRICGHSYRVHLHVYYNSVQVPVQVEDHSVAEALKGQVSAKEAKDTIIQSKIREIKEYENELRAIEKASIRFACFLKRNAITPYNDAQEDYLNHLISEEKNNVAQGGSVAKALLKSLQESLASYLESKRILEEQMDDPGCAEEAPGPKDIEKLVDGLKNLKYNGRSLQQALECVKHAQNVEYRETTLQPAGFRNKKTSYSDKLKSKFTFWF